MPRFAANLTMMFNEVPFPQRFAAAAQAGFKGVEFLFPYDHAPQEVAGWLREHGLLNVLFNLPPGDWAAGERGIASLPGREEEFRAGVARAIEYALALGTPRVHMMAGLLPVGADVKLHRATYLANLRYAAQAVGEHGLELLIEPINGRDMPGYFLSRSSQALDIIAEAACPNLFLQYDIYHMQRMEGELSNTIRAHLPLIKHMQIADTPGRHEPGSGEINYRHLFALIDELGYDGWLGCEYLPAGPTSAGLDWRERLVG